MAFHKLGASCFKRHTSRYESSSNYSLFDTSASEKPATANMATQADFSDDESIDADSDDEVDERPKKYQCKGCGDIYYSLNDVKKHYESIHIADKAVMCKLVPDEVYDAVEEIYEDEDDEDQRDEDGNNLNENSDEKIFNCSNEDEILIESSDDDETEEKMSLFEALEKSLKQLDGCSSQDDNQKSNSVVKESNLNHNDESRKLSLTSSNSFYSNERFSSQKVQKPKATIAPMMREVTDTDNDGASVYSNIRKIISTGQKRRISSESESIEEKRIKSNQEEEEEQTITVNKDNSTNTTAMMSTNDSIINSDDTNSKINSQKSSSVNKMKKKTTKNKRKTTKVNKPSTPLKQLKILEEKIASGNSNNDNNVSNMNNLNKASQVPRENNFMRNIFPMKCPYYPQIHDNVVIRVSKYFQFYTSICQNLKNTTILETFLNVKDEIVRGTIKMIDYHRDSNDKRYAILRIATKPTYTANNEQIINKYYIAWSTRPSPDYIVLEQNYKMGNWLVGDRFRSLVNYSWWTGEIINYKPEQVDMYFNCFEIRWDADGSTEYLSPWELEQINTARKSKNHKTTGMPLIVSELALFEVTTYEDDWPEIGCKRYCERLINALETLIKTKLYHSIVAKIDERNMRKIALDLNVVIGRLKYNFYHRKISVIDNISFFFTQVNQLLGDVKLENNWLKISEVLLEFIEDIDSLDILKMLEPHFSADKLAFIDTQLPVQNAHISSVPSSSSDSVVKKKKIEAKISTATSDFVNNSANDNVTINDSFSLYEKWTSDSLCLIEKISQEDFAKPFIDPVSKEDYPEYYKIIKESIDLKTIEKRLRTGHYLDLSKFRDDIRLLISNSRCFNANKTTLIYNYTSQLEYLLNKGFKKISEDYETMRRLEKKRTTRYK